MDFALRTQLWRRLGLFQITVLATGKSLVFIFKHQRHHWPWIIARADDTLYGEAQNDKLQLIAFRYCAFYFSMQLRQDVPKVFGGAFIPKRTGHRHWKNEALLSCLFGDVDQNAILNRLRA